MPYIDDQASIQSFRGFLGNIARRQREDGLTLLTQEAARRERERQRAIENAMNVKTQEFIGTLARGKVVPGSPATPGQDPSAAPAKAVPYSDAERNEMMTSFGLQMMQFGEAGLKRSKEVFDLIEAAGKNKDDTGEWSYETPVKDAESGNVIEVMSNKRGEVKYRKTPYKFPETTDPFDLFVGKQRVDEVNKEAKRYRDARTKVDKMRNDPETKRALTVLQREGMVDAADPELQKMVVAKLLDPGMVQRVKDLRAAESEVEGARSNLSSYEVFVDEKDGWKVKKGQWPDVKPTGGQVIRLSKSDWSKALQALKLKGYDEAQADKILRDSGREPE